jgi:DHA3 family macrolide efflux protein-like MFS transporter
LTQATGSATVLATAALVALLPRVLLGPVAGALVDRHNRKHIIMLADAGVALGAAVLMALFAAGLSQPWHVYVIMALRGAGHAFHEPAIAASYALLVPQDQLARTSGINQSTSGLVNVLAPALGAFALGTLPMGLVLAFDVLTAMFAVGAMGLTRLPQPTRLHVPDAPCSSLWVEMREGLDYVLGWRGLRWVLVMSLLINFVLIPAGALQPIWIVNHFGGAANEVALMESGWALGTIAGGIALGVWGGFRSRLATAFAALACMGVCFTLAGMMPQYAFVSALFSFGLGGFFNPIVNGSFGAMMQGAITPHMQGRVMSLFGTLSSAIAPISLLMAGPLADGLGVAAVMVAGGVICVLIGLFGRAVPSVRALEREAGARASQQALVTLGY